MQHLSVTQQIRSPRAQKSIVFYAAYLNALLHTLLQDP